MSSVPILCTNVNVLKVTMLKFDTNLDANVHIDTKDPFTLSESGNESENFVCELLFDLFRFRFRFILVGTGPKCKRTFMTRSHRAKVNVKAKKDHKEQSEEIKENISNIKEKFRFLSV